MCGVYARICTYNTNNNKHFLHLQFSCLHNEAQSLLVANIKIHSLFLLRQLWLLKTDFNYEKKKLVLQH